MSLNGCTFWTDKQSPEHAISMYVSLMDTVLDKYIWMQFVKEHTFSRYNLSRIDTVL